MNVSPPAKPVRTILTRVIRVAITAATVLLAISIQFDLPAQQPGQGAKEPAKDVTPVAKSPLEEALDRYAEQDGEAALETLSLKGIEMEDDDLAQLARFPGIKNLRLADTLISGEGLVHLRHLPRLEELDLEDTQIDDDSMKHLPDLPNLRVLWLSDTKVADKSLESLKKLDRLETLGLSGTEVTGAGLAHLASLASLKKVSLSDTPLTDGGLEQLAKLSSLETLFLRDTTVTGKGLAHLRSMSSLKSLYLDYIELSRSDWSFLEGLTGLEVLSLEDATIPDADLSCLKNMKDLRSLYLAETAIDDKALESLPSLPSLEYLDLTESGVTGTGLTRIANLPRLEVLDLWGTPLTDAGLENILPLSSLKSLDVGATNVTDVGLPNLATLTGLEKLELDSNQISGEGIHHLLPLKNLRKLILTETPIVDEDVQTLKELSKLETLDLAATDVTDTALPHLNQLLQLEYVNLIGTKVTAGGVDQLQKELPDAEIVAIRGTNSSADSDITSAEEAIDGIEAAQDCFWDRENFERCILTQKRIIAVYRTLYPEGHPDLAMALNRAGVYSSRSGDRRAALPHYEAAVKVFRQLHPDGDMGEDFEDYCLVLGNIGYALNELGDNGDRDAWEKTIPAYEEVLAELRRCYPAEKYPHGHSELIEKLNKVGGILEDRGEDAKAQPYLEEALAMCEGLYSESDEEIGVLYYSVLRNLYSCLLHTGDRRARTYLEKAIEVARRRYPADKYPNGHWRISNSLGSLSWLVYKLGDNAGGLEYAKESLEMYQRLYPSDQYPEGHSSVASAMYTMGAAWSHMGDQEKAHEFYVEAYEMLTRLRQKEGATISASDDRFYGEIGLHVAGGLKRNPGNEARIKALCEEALEASKLNHPPEQYPNGSGSMAWTLLMVGGTLSGISEEESMGYVESAVEMFRHHYPRSEYPRGDFHYGNALNALAGRLRGKGEYQRAIEVYREALELNRLQYPPEEYPEGSPALSITLMAIGLLEALAGDYDPAYEHMAEAARQRQELANAFAALTSEAEALNYAVSIPGGLDHLISLGPLAGRSAQDIYPHIWRARGAIFQFVSERQRAMIGDASPDVQELYQEYAAVRRELASLAFAPAAGVSGADSRRKSIEELTRRKEALERKLSGKMGKMGRREAVSRQPPSDLVKALPGDTAFVDLVAYRSHDWKSAKPGASSAPQVSSYVAFVLMRDRPFQMIHLGAAKAIDEAARDWRSAITSGKSTDASIQLRQLIWEPVEAVFPPEIKKVVITPDGSLASIPWAALPGPNNESALIEKYAFAVVPNGAFLLGELTGERSLTPDAGKLLALGDVAYDAESPVAGQAPLLTMRAPNVKPDALLSWPALPGTREELRALQAAAEGRDIVTLTGPKASTGRVLDELPRANWAVFATHGFFADPSFRAALRLDESLFGKSNRTKRVLPATRSPLLMSGIVLAGANRDRKVASAPGATTDTGILTAEAIAALPLQNLDLAVLSACDTGLGDVAGGEGVFGLQRAFHQGGTRWVVASLWQVSDLATAALMQIFYSKVWQENLDPAQALHEAQLELYRSPELISQFQDQRGVGGISKTPGSSQAQEPVDWTRNIQFWAGFTVSGVGLVED